MLRRLAPSLAGVFAISFSAILVRAANVGPATAGAYRCLLALPILLLLERRRPAPAAAARVALVAGLFLAGDLVLYHAAIGRIGAGPSSVLANTQVFWVIGLTVLYLHRPVGRRPLVGAVIVLAGVALLRGVGSD